MPGTWFSADHLTELEISRRSKSDTAEDKTTSSPIATVLATHDEILAELYGHSLEPTTSTTNINTVNTPEVIVISDESFNEPATNQDSPAPASTVPTYTSNSASASTPLSKLYDPFSGTTLGVLTTQHDSNVFSDAGSTNDEELWLHLAEILRLQSDIAEAHLQMEDIGAKNESKDWTAGEGGEGGVDDEGSEGDEDVEGEKAKEEKFAKLADTFSGRRQKIDGVMSKLSDLSRALTTFHALRTPVVDFSRSNTHPNTPVTPPSHIDTRKSDTDSKPSLRSHSIPQPSSSRTRPILSRPHSSSLSSAVPLSAIQQQFGILQQPVVESPLSMTAGTVPHVPHE